MMKSVEQIRKAMNNGDGEAVKALLDEIGYEEVYERMKKEIQHGWTLLQHVVNHDYHVEVVRAVLSSLGSNAEQVRAITENSHRAVHEAVPLDAGRQRVDILDLLVDTLGDDYNLLQIESPSSRSFHTFATSSFKVFRRVCDLLGDDATFYQLSEMYFDNFCFGFNSGGQAVIGRALGSFHSDGMTHEEKGWLARKVEMLLDHLGDGDRNFICNTHILNDAVEGGHEEIVTLFLDRLGKFGTPYAISKKDRYGRTVFHISAESGNVNIFKLLIEKVNDDGESKVAATCEGGKTVVHCAAGCTDILKVAIEQFSSSEAAQAVILQEGRTISVLHMAVCEKNLTGIELLLGTFKDLENAKQAISKQDSSGWNLLHRAVKHGAVEIFQMLMLTLGPKQSMEMLSQQITQDGNTVLHLVRDPSLVKLIQLVVSSSVFKHELICQTNKLGQTPFHTAAMLDVSLVFKELVKWSKMDSEEVEKEITGRKDRDGRTALHIALQHHHPEVFMDMVESVDNAAGCFQLADGNGQTILRQYVINSDHQWESRLKYILDKVGIEQLRILLKQTNNELVWMLHIASGQSRKQFNDLLDICGLRSATEEIKGILGGGPGHEHRALHVACELGNEFLVKFLLENGSKSDIMEQDELFLGNTALHAAAIGSNKQVFKILVDALGSKTVDINQCVNWYGQTPLHFAMASCISRGDLPLVKYLIKKRGANPAQSDYAGATCAHFGGRSGDLDICEDAFKACASVDSLNVLCMVTEAGMTPLHYQAWNTGLNFSLRKEWFVNSLEEFDTVEHMTPFLWGAKAILSDPSIEITMDAYLRAKKNPLNGFTGTLLLSNKCWDHGFCNQTMELMCRELIQKEPDLMVTSVFVACTLGYGDVETNRQLAQKLLEVHNDDSSKLANLLEESKGLHFAAMCSSSDSKRKTTLSAFLVTLVDDFKGDKDILFKLQVQLESAFQVALVNNVEDGFLHVLVKYMQPICVRELLQTRLCKVTRSSAYFEGQYQSLSSAEKSKMKDVHKMVEDIPLAYWITLAQLIKQDSSPELRGDSQENIHELEAETLSLVMRMVDNEPPSDTWGNLKVDSQYPNGVGRYTRRTALHWAVILGEKEIVTRLTEDTRCKKDVVDDFGKPAYWYALLHKDKFKFKFEDKQGYITFIDLLKWHDYNVSLLYKDRDMYVEGLNAILVGAALIATVAFTGLVTPPLQYPVMSSRSTPDLKYIAVYMPEVQVFWVANSMSFFLSMTSVLACVTGILPAFDLEEVERIRRVLVRAATFLVLSILFILLAFVCAGFSVLPKAMSRQANMIVTTIVGGAFCVFRLGKFGRAIYLLTPRLKRVNWWLKSNIKLPFYDQPKANTKAVVEEAEAEAKPERRTYKRGSIHEHIVNSGGFSNGPYSWDDGLWVSPFAEIRKPTEAGETSRSDVAIDVQEAGPSHSVV